MNAITILVAVFCVLGAIDYLLDNRFGIGAEFERGFKLMGNSALSMIGMIVLAPWLAVTLSPLLEAIANNTPFDPSVLAGTLLLLALEPRRAHIFPENL